MAKLVYGLNQSLDGYEARRGQHVRKLRAGDSDGLHLVQA
jgi:hypothetical protein